jgi:choline dehydrogenase-like flavoprotein
MSLVVVGAGPSGLHFALTALERGRKVTLVDVGNTGRAVPLPQASFEAFKETYADSVGYFLGDDYSGALVPSPAGASDQEYYALPKSKDYVFAAPAQARLIEDGLAPLSSFAAGGLAECWTAGAYTFDDADLTDFPFGYAEMAPHYGTVARRIGVGGAPDDLAAFIPVHDNLAEPVRLNEPSARLLAAYDRKRARLATRHAVRLGRSRQATLSSALGERAGCSECGRCLWGCPTGALYTPSYTLRQCLTHPGFTYLPGRFASHFTLSGTDNLDTLVVHPVGGGTAEEVRGEAYVLASGALNSSRIFLRTLYFGRGELAKLGGLMDNRQVLAPFYLLDMLGRRHRSDAYQYHQLAVGARSETTGQYVHGQVTMFSSGVVHPVIQQLPFDLRTASNVFAAVRSGLGVLNLNFHDYRRETNFVALEPDPSSPDGELALKVRYRPRPEEDEDIRRTLAAMNRFFLDLGAPIIPGMTKLRPMGAGVHYAGTLPMSRESAPHTVGPDGRSYDFGNLYVADGAILPFLPAKNLTFTLMANATRIAAGMA